MKDSNSRRFSTTHFTFRTHAEKRNSRQSYGGSRIQVARLPSCLNLSERTDERCQFIQRTITEDTVAPPPPQADDAQPNPRDYYNVPLPDDGAFHRILSLHFNPHLPPRTFKNKPQQHRWVKNEAMKMKRMVETGSNTGTTAATHGG